MVIEIKIRSSKTKLAGYDLGLDLYKDILGDTVKDKKFRLVFDDNIDFVAPSFINGFFYNIVKEIGIDGVEKNFEIESNTIVNIKARVINSLR